jgi:TetR/AcrR family transcriptional regulator, cholesterol catabolism regulator
MRKTGQVTKNTKSGKRNMPANDRLQQICRVASNLFCEKGFWETTTKEIAEACGISVGTLFYHIKSKYDFPLLFNKVHLIDMDTWEKEIRKEMDDAAPEAILRKAVRTLVKLIDLRDKIILFWSTTAQYLEWGQLEDIVNTDLRVVGLFKEIIDKGCREGRFKASNPLLTAVNIEMICHTWVLKGWYLYHFYTVEQYADICEQHAVLMARGSADLALPADAGYPVIEAKHLKNDWDQRRKERPQGHGSDSWLHTPTKIDYRST